MDAAITLVVINHKGREANALRANVLVVGSVGRTDHGRGHNCHWLERSVFLHPLWITEIADGDGANRLETGTTDARGRRGFGAAGAQLHFDTTGKVRPGNRLTAARHNVGHARALEHAEVNVGPHILRHYVGAGAATLDLRGRAGGRHQRIELFAGEAIADNGIPVGGNFIGRVEPQLDELGGKQVGHARRPLDIADCGDGTAEHLE